MKITAGHRPKSDDIAGLAVQFTSRSVIMARQGMRLHAILNYIITTCSETPSHQNGYRHSQAKDNCGIELEWRLENEAVEKASVKRHFPKVATDLQEGVSVDGVATC